MYIQREQRRQQTKEIFSRVHPVQDVVSTEDVKIVEGVAMVNPVHRAEKNDFELVNTFFPQLPHHVQSSRNLTKPFPPQQARRASFAPTTIHV
jgi:hypothetical protein